MRSSSALSLTVFAASALASPDYPTITSTSDSYPTASSSCTATICVDKINSCGLRYGGCFASCSGSPWPSFTDPGCPTSSATPSLTTFTVPTSTSCTNFKCVDSINSCGQTYGGCYYDCPGSATPIFTDPGCPSTTSPPPTSSCTTTLCVDKINSCGQMYGGCFPACSGFTTPSFTDPGCPTTSSASPTSSSTSCPYICRDYFDDCGNTYGSGCYTSCPGAPVPTFTTPYCDASATPTSYV